MEIEKNIVKSRRKSRIFALQYLYSIEFIDDKKFNLDNIKFIIPELESDLFSIELIKGVLNNQPELDTLISTKASWNFNRINNIDKNLLRLGFFELKSDLDKKIIINEYIEIAKIYSTLDSSAFINGILDS